MANEHQCGTGDEFRLGAAPVAIKSTNKRTVLLFYLCFVPLSYCKTQKKPAKISCALNRTLSVLK